MRRGLAAPRRSLSHPASTSLVTGHLSRLPRRPPRIRTITFPLPPPHLPDDPLVVTGFAVFGRLTRVAPPPMRFVFLGAGFCLGLPSDPASRRCRYFRPGVRTTAYSRGLSPPSNRPCRACQEEGAARRRPLPTPLGLYSHFPFSLPRFRYCAGASGGMGPTWKGRIISLSSCSTMWQCHT